LVCYDCFRGVYTSEKWSDLRYAIHFTDGSKIDCLTLEGAMRVIASRHRVRRGDLITDTTEEKILVWLYPRQMPIAEIFVSSVRSKTVPLRRPDRS